MTDEQEPDVTDETTEVIETEAGAQEPRIIDVHDVASLDEAAAAIEAGECIVLPTDTVYGVGADAFSSAAVQRLLDAKRRGREMPPPVLIAERGMLRALTDGAPQAALDLADAFWPGALTLILRAQRTLRLEIGETGGTVAVRVPDHDAAREVLRRTGPLAVSSANISGSAPATTIGEAAGQLGATVALYLDAGTSPGGVASTIIDFTSTDAGRIVRVGAIAFDRLVEIAPDLEPLPVSDPEPGAQVAQGPEAPAVTPAPDDLGHGATEEAPPDQSGN